MVNYRLIMSLLLDGTSYRNIHARTQCSHSTTSKARTALNEHAITTHAQLAGYSDDELTSLIGDGRVSTSENFVPIDVKAVLKARTGRKKTPLNVLWSNYLTLPATGGQSHYGYERFRQIIGHEAAARGLTSRIKHSPGLTMQVDWAGSTMRLVDPITAKTTRISVFVATLPYSGMVFAEGFINQRQPNWLAAHRHAFDYLGGVAEVIVPDNASTASNVFSVIDGKRRVNTSYEEFLAHYNTAAAPTREAKPKDKASVEAGVKVVTNWVINKLAERTFTNLDDLNAAVRQAVDEINDRTPFRDQPISRRMIFKEAETHLLADLPATAFEPTTWKKSKVAPDWHITIATVHYSVPYRHIGQVVNVRIRGEVLEVFAGGETVATHTVNPQRGAYVTDIAHCPPGMEIANNLWTSDYFLSQAARVGPHTRAAIANLLDSKPVVAQAYLPSRNILSMGKGDNKTILEQACHRLVGDDSRRRAITYTAVKNMMAAVRAERAARPTTTPSSPPRPAADAPPPVRDRGGLLGGPEQFSLDALTDRTRGQESK